MKAHPTNRHGLLVQCFGCGKDVHVPRAEVTMETRAWRITCSTACRDKRASTIAVLDGIDAEGYCPGCELGDAGPDIHTCFMGRAARELDLMEATDAPD
jgi:hypothetical protein